MHLDVKTAIAACSMLLVSAGFLTGAIRYGVGTPSSMGAGFFPMVASVLLIVLSAAMLIGAIGRSEVSEKVSWRPLAAVLSGIACFALLIEEAGFLPAVVMTAATSSLLDRSVTVWRVLALSIAIGFGSWAIFLLGLNLSIPVLRI